MCSPQQWSTAIESSADGGKKNGHGITLLEKKERKRKVSKPEAKHSSVSTLWGFVFFLFS